MGQCPQDYFFDSPQKTTLEVRSQQCYNYSSRGFRVCPEQRNSKNTPKRSQANSLYRL